MRYIKHYGLAFGVAMICLLSGCRSKQAVNSSYSYQRFDTSAVNVSPSGSVTVRAWGSGHDRRSSMQTAMKNAVSDVIFKGLKGASGYSGQPIVTEVNARERYADYFDRFFADGGEYEHFVWESSTKDKSRTQAKSAGRENYGLTLEVDRPALVRQLTEDGIIKR